MQTAFFAAGPRRERSPDGGVYDSSGRHQKRPIPRSPVGAGSIAKKTFMQTWGEYGLARAAAASMDAFPIDANLRTAAWIGRGVDRLDRKHRGRGQQHIRQCFPEWSDARVRRCHEASIEHLVQLALEVVQTPRIVNPGSWHRHVSIANLGPALELMNRREPSLMVTGHLGNWELLGHVMALLGYPLNVISRPLDNQALNRWMSESRAKRGLKLIVKWGAVEEMNAALDVGEPVSFLADQNAGEKGIFVPFFGRLGSAYKSIAILAIRKKLPIVCGYCHRVGPGFQHEVGVQDVIRPEDWADRDDAIFYVCARFVRAIENMVRRRPAQYFWMHRRWKSRPRWEKADKPLPDKVQEKLRSLPWMTDAEMGRILAWTDRDRAELHGRALGPIPGLTPA